MALKLFLDGLKELDISLDATQQQQFETYINELKLFNPTYRLIASNDDDFIAHHLLDCASASKLLDDKGDTICDIGSGGGLPGIVLAILLKQRNFVLVERSSKRCGFLRNVVTLCNLSAKVEIVEKDLKEIKDKFSLVTFRAVSPLQDIVEDLEKILKDGGVIFAYKGKKEELDKELASLTSIKQTKVVPIKVPFSDVERNIVIIGGIENEFY